MTNVLVKIVKLNEEAVLPKYATPGSACFDFVAMEDIILVPGQTGLIKTGLAVEVPENYKIAIYPRSGISLKTPLRMGNSVGQVDSDYRGEIGVIIHNTGIACPYTAKMAMTIDNEPIEMDNPAPINTYVIRKGDRIAQGAIEAAIQADFQLVKVLSSTDRGQGGFGSTGIK